MGKKYIIELEDKPFHKDGDFLCRVKGFNSLVFDMTGINKLTPYTEPDLEQVRANAYEDGYKTAKVQCNIQAEKDMREVGKKHYQKGLSDAWEAMRKIHDMTWREKIDVFGTDYYADIIALSVSEAIEKIRAYEQAQKELEQEQNEEKPIRAEDVMRQYLTEFCKKHSCRDGACALHTPDFKCGRGYHFLTDSPVSDEEVRRAYAKVVKE